MRSSWATDIASGGQITVEDGRVALAALMAPGLRSTSTGDRPIARAGFRPGLSTDPGAVTATGGGTLSVAPFQYVMPTSRATGGAYIVSQDTTYTFNGLATPAHSTYGRIDRIIVQQDDTFYGDSDSTCTIRQVVGTPSATPALPSVTGSADWIELARINVGAGQTNLTLTGTVVDMRPADKFTVASGGLLPVPNQAARDAITGAYDGMPVWLSDQQRVDVRNSGGGWTTVSAPPAALVPVGGIIMWSGLIANIPTNWHLCDGTSGTPDLRGRMIIGASADSGAGNSGSAYNVAATGGADSTSLAESNLPAHSHTSSVTGNHQHTMKYRDGLSWTKSTGAGFHLPVVSGETDYTGTTDTFTYSGGSHGHSIGFTGSGVAFENRPRFYALAFIMRTA